MDTIVIDPFTGHVGTSSMLQTPATPSLHKSSIGRSVKRALQLETYTGSNTKVSSVGGKRMHTTSLETCEFILDNITGPGWDDWRVASGQEFKQALRERVETVLSSISNSQREQQRPQQQASSPPLEEQQQQVQEQQSLQQPQQVEEIETKEAKLQKAMCAINTTGDIRVDNATLRVSAIDTIRMVCPSADANYAGQLLIRIMEKDKDDRATAFMQDACESVLIADRVERIQINGTGHFTPVTDAKTIVEIIWLLPTGKAREFRRQSAETICRVLGGDVTLCAEIEQRCSRLQSTEEGRAYQQFMGVEQHAKKARVGPAIMEHATEEQYQRYVETEVSQELATREHNLALIKTKAIHDQMNEEVGVVLSMKEALEAIRPLGDTDIIELHDKMSDISYRTFRKVGGGQNLAAVSGGEMVAPAENALAVATAVDASHVDPGHGVATPDCHMSVRGDEISIAQISGFMGVRPGGLAGQVGKRMKALYTAQYGEVAGGNIPKRTTRFNGKPFSENVYFARDRNLMEQAIREVAHP